jgi:hypothetical protein
MALQRGSAGVLAIGVPGTSGAYGTAVTASHIFAVDAFGESNTPGVFDTSSTTSGAEEGYGLVGTTMRKSITISGTVCDKSFPILNALALGQDTLTTIDTTLRQHVTQSIAIDAELPTFSLYFKQTGISDTTSVGSIKFDGCCIDTLTLTGDPSGVWKWSATIMTSGLGTSLTTDFSSGLTKPTIAGYRFHRTDLVRSTSTPSAFTADPGTSPYGGSASGAGGGSGNNWTNSDLSAAVKSISITINNNLQPIYTAGNVTGVATGVTRTQRTVNMSVSFYMGAITSTYITGRITGVNVTAVDPGSMDAFIIRCFSANSASATYNYGFEYAFPYVTCIGTEADKTIGPRGVTANYIISKNGSLASVYAVGWNLDNVDYA